MTSPELLRPLLDLDDDALTEWLLTCVQGGSCDPLSRTVPAHYDNVTDYLIDSLFATKDDSTLLRFGNAAAKGFMKFLKRGGFYDYETNRLRILAISTLLSLIENLPASPENAEQLVKCLLLILGGHADHTLTEGEIDIRARMLLALGSKLLSVTHLEPEVSELFVDDLSNPDYIVPAYAIILRLNVSSAAKHLRTALHTLEVNDLPTVYLIFDIARVITQRPEGSGRMLEVIKGSASKRVKDEFRNSLLRVNRADLVNKLDDPDESTTESLKDIDSSVSKDLIRGEYDAANLVLNNKPGPDLLTQAIRSFPDNPIEVGQAIGRMLSVLRWATKESEEDFKVGSVPFKYIGNLIRNLDNGYWADRTTLSDNLPAPSWFNTQNRRLIAAHSIRQCVEEVIDEGKVTINSEPFTRAIEGTVIPSWIEEVSSLIPNINRKVVKVAVSPFPEDRAFFAVLREAAKITKSITFEAIPTNWGQSTSEGGQPDFALVNEYAPIPELRRTDTEDDVYTHKGYYVFFDNTVERPDSALERFRLAFNKGLAGYWRGEYEKIIPEIQSAIDDYSRPQDGRQEHNWSEDFQSFVTGTSQVYLGGSINSRLLMRVWLPNINRMAVLCEPKDFDAFIKNFPSNRLIISSRLKDQIARWKRNQFRSTVVKLYRYIGQFIHDVAVEARRTHSDTVMPIIRQFMTEVAPQNNKHPEGMWNFVVHEEDMITILLDDSDFSSPRDVS